MERLDVTPPGAFIRCAVGERERESISPPSEERSGPAPVGKWVGPVKFATTNQVVYAA